MAAPIITSESQCLSSAILDSATPDAKAYISGGTILTCLYRSAITVAKAKAEVVWPDGNESNWGSEFPGKCSSDAFVKCQ